MKILMTGDIVGQPGRTAFARTAGRMREQRGVDMIIANAENSAGGRGITPVICDELFAAGADVLTLGDHTWDQKELAPWLKNAKRVVRPANFAPGCPGTGCVTVMVKNIPVTVISLVGRVFMSPYDCPFRTADQILAQKNPPGGIIMVDVHAEATSEKIALGRYLDGRVSAVAGTHTHVQTADEEILPGGTAYITDLGMTGPKDSILGRDVNSVLQKFLTGMPSRFSIATEKVAFEGALVTVDDKTCRATGIERVREYM